MAKKVKKDNKEKEFKVSKEEVIKADDIIQQTDNIKDLYHLSFTNIEDNVNLNKKLILKLFEKLAYLEATIKKGKF